MTDELKTARLQLRRLHESDAGLLLKIWNDPDFIRHVCDRGIRTLDQSRQAMREGVLAIWEEQGYGPYRVSLTGSGEDVGICGLFKRPFLDRPDIGYALLPRYCGLGYALEAALAVREHARDTLKLPSITGLVSPEHERSIGLLQKLGMRYEGPIRIPDENEDIALYTMDL